jgi:phosphatidylinositol alpha-mannosyltransferase
VRIALVSPYAMDRPGGVQQQAASLVEWLRDEGHDAWLVAPGRSGGPSGTVHLGETLRVRTNRSVAPIRLTPGTVADVEDALAGADVVHIHEPFVPAVSLAALRTPGVPKVGTFHADPGWGVRLLYGAGRWGWRILARNLHAAVAVSPVAAAGIRAIVGEPRLIPNAIDVRSYDSSTRKDPTRIAFLGRDEPRKGLDVLVVAFRRLQRVRPDVELVVMGADRPTLPGIRFMGPVDDATKRTELARASVLVAPNTGGESFGLVVLEGLAAGCAVVASSLPAFRFVGADAALYVSPGEAAGLQQALQTLVANSDIRQEYQQRARERSRVFDRGRMVADYLKLYAQAVDKFRE